MAVLALCCAALPAGGEDEAALFLPVGGEAEPLFAHALRRARAADWAGAADLAARAIELYPDAVLPVPGQPGRFGAAPDVIGAAVAGWPVAGLQAWRTVMEPAARRLLAAGEPAGVIARFPVTAAAGAALAQLADAALEAGDVGVAADRFDQLIARSTLSIPDPWLRDPAAVVQRAAVAYGGAGLIGRLERLQANPLVAHGPPAVAAAVAAAMARARRAARTAAVPGNWPTMGGDNRRAGVGGPAVDLATPPAWTEPLPALPDMRIEGWQRLVFVRETDRSRSHVHPAQLQRRYRPVVPIVVDGVVYATTGMAVQAWELYTGRAVREPFFDQRPPMGVRDKFEPCLVHTLTAAGGALFAQVGIPNQEVDRYSTWDIKEPIPQRRLVCLDARTGRVRWAVGGGAQGGAGGWLDAGSVVAAPCVDGDSVLVVVRQGQGGKGSYWALALDVADGAVRWQRRICDGGSELNMFGRPLREAVVAPPAVHGGLVYVSTNIGAVVALELRTGRIRWIARYPVAHIPRSQNFQPEKRAPIWATAAPVISGDLVLMAPTDSPYLLALDRRTGATRWRLSAEDPDGISEHYYLLGAVRGLVIVSGNRLVALDVETGTARWAVPADPVDEGDDPPGRGALTADRIYWPTQRHLRVYDLDGGIVGARAWAEMGPSAAPGNVTCVGGALLISWVREGQPGLTVLCDRTVVLTDLETQARRSPADAAPLLTAAEVRLQADDDLALVRLTLRRAAERIALTPPGSGRLALEARHRAALLRLGLRTAREAQRRGHPAEALAALESALTAATEPADRVRVLLQIADHHEAQQRPAAVQAALRRIADELGDVPFVSTSATEPVPAGLVALLRSAEFAQSRPGGGGDYVATLQEILVRYPETPMPRDAFRPGDAPTAAGQWARDRLRTMLQRGGRQHYARFDAEARALVDGAGAAEAESVLHTLLSRYPNAEVLPAAVLRLADLLRAAGRPAAAADALRRWLRETPAEADAAAASWLLARCYEQQAMWAAARAVLERLRDAHGHVRVRPTPEAAPAPVRELVTERLAAPQYAAAPPTVVEPALATPLAVRYQADLPPSAQLVSVRGPAPTAARGRVFVQHDGELSARAAASGEVQWRTAVGVGRVFDCVAGEQWLLVSTVRQLAAVDPADGTVRWQRTVPASARPLWIGASRGLVVVAGTPTDNRKATLVHAFDEASGQPLWQSRVQGMVLPWPLARDGAVALWCGEHTGVDYVRTLRVLDLLSGAERFVVPCGPTALNGDLPGPVFLPHGPLAVVVGGTQVRALDPQTGAVTWSCGIGAEGPRGALLVGATQLLVQRAQAAPGDPRALWTAVDAQRGSPNWDLALRNTQAGAVELAGDDLFVPRVLPDGRLVAECYDARDGRTLRWRGDLGLSQAQVSKLLVARTHVVAVVNTPLGRAGRLEVQLIVFERSTGKLVQDPLAPGGEFDQIPLVALADDGTVILQTGGWLAGFGRAR